MDLANAISSTCKNKLLGFGSEKIHEEMITSADSPTTFDLGKYYAILPSSGDNFERYISNTGDNPWCPKAFHIIREIITIFSLLTICAS